MLGLKYIHFDAMDYVIHYKNGRIQKKGKGLAFLYFAPTSSIVCIPTASQDLHFSFSEMTKDYQAVTIEGELSWRVTDSQKLAEMMDFTVDENKKYRKDELAHLSQRLDNEVHTSISNLIQHLDLRESLHSLMDIEAHLTASLKSSKVVNMLGVEILKVSILAIKPSPEMARTLETETREALQHEADQATYERQRFAMEQERRIQEAQLNIEAALEQKQKEITEQKMETAKLEQDTAHQICIMKLKASIDQERIRRTMNN